MSEPVSSSLAGRLQRRLDVAAARNEGYGGALLRIEAIGGGVLWQGASGELAHAAARPIGFGDTFEIASVTKMFTSVCVLELVERGQLSLDDTIGRFLPPRVTRGLLVIDGHDHGPELTIRQLLHHTSGLPDYFTDPPLDEKGENAFVRDFLADEHRIWAPGELIDYARALWPISAPGEKYHYSDTGYVLLGMVLERVSGLPLHELFRRQLFGPLHLVDTFALYREPAPRRRPLAHRYEGTLDLHLQARQSAGFGGGGLVSSLDDLARFMRALARGELLEKPSTREEMMSFAPTETPGVDYGLGLFRVELDDPRQQLFGHDGHGNVFAWMLPDRELIIVGTLDQLQNDWWPLVSGVLRELSEP
jgi:CubicO group peptidase (beta-lactamase class C family)